MHDRWEQLTLTRCSQEVRWRGNECYLPRKPKRFSNQVSIRACFIQTPLHEGDPMNRFRAYSYGMLAVAWLVLTLCFATTLFAQTDTGSVRGTVTDEQGRAVPQAQVTISNTDTAYSRSVKSD